MIIESGIDCLRDPFIILENGVYYAYGTEWKCYRNTSGRLDGNWELYDGELVVTPEDYVKDPWAPEVHKYGGSYYMFTSYFSSATNHRGCSVFKSDSPLGPFVEHTKGHFTPSDWDSIDATFYVDEDGQPWTVFVHEWTSTDDKIGRMAVARLSSDLKKLIDEPVEVFRADSAPWTKREVTDGCFVRRTNSGKLLMLWSNFLADRTYCVGVLESESGILGPWVHKEELLYSKELSGEYDGGHAMIFRDIEGKEYVALHSPNFPTNKRSEKPIFIPLTEQSGELKLVLD